jgi:RNA polymerase sigma factor (sigma-70 family)
MGVSGQPAEVAVVEDRRTGRHAVSVTEVVVERDEAVALLFYRHCTALVGLAFCLLGDRGAAEEVVQDAFVALHRHWSGLREQGSALPYLRAAVVNGCRSRQRRLVRARAGLAALRPLTTLVPSSEDTAVSHDEAARVAAAVRSLPTRQREVLVCRFYLDLTETQTATLLQMGRSSVKTHTRRGLAGLTRRLEVTT